MKKLIFVSPKYICLYVKLKFKGWNVLNISSILWKSILKTFSSWSDIENHWMILSLNGFRKILISRNSIKRYFLPKIFYILRHIHVKGVIILLNLQSRGNFADTKQVRNSADKTGMIKPDTHVFKHRYVAVSTLGQIKALLIRLGLSNLVHMFIMIRGRRQLFVKVKVKIYQHLMGRIKSTNI